MEVLRFLLLCVIGVCFVLSFFFEYQVVSALRLRHKAVWRSLGSPGFLASSSIVSQLKLRRYTRNGLHSELGDTGLSLSVSRRRWSERIYLIGITAYISTMFFIANG